MENYYLWLLETTIWMKLLDIFLKSPQNSQWTIDISNSCIQLMIEELHYSATTG